MVLFFNCSGVQNSDDDWEDIYCGGNCDPSAQTGDGDTLNYLDEFLHHTNPNLPDTDGDQMPDDWEVEFELNPIDNSDKFADADGDGLSNIHEKMLGTIPKCTNAYPNCQDSDGDGLIDGIEDANDNGIIENEETIPSLADSDYDLEPDGTDSMPRNYNIHFSPGPTIDCDIALSKSYYRNNVDISVCLKFRGNPYLPSDESQRNQIIQITPDPFSTGSDKEFEVRISQPYNSYWIDIACLRIYSHDSGYILIRETSRLYRFNDANGNGVIDNNDWNLIARSIYGEETGVDHYFGGVWAITTDFGGSNGIRIRVDDIDNTWDSTINNDLDHDGLLDSQEIQMDKKSYENVIHWFDNIIEIDQYSWVKWGPIYHDDSASYDAAAIEGLGDTILDLTTPNYLLTPGSYKIFFKARGKDITTSPSIQVSRMTRPGFDTIYLTENYQFYSTNIFTISDSQEGINFKILDYGDQQAFVDKVAIVKMHTDIYELESSQMTDPADPDTDGDGLNDFAELNRNIKSYWIEAEDYAQNSLDVIDGGQIQESIGASNDKSIIQNGAFYLFYISDDDIHFEPSIYRIYINAYSEVPNSKLSISIINTPGFDCDIILSTERVFSNNYCGNINIGNGFFYIHATASSNDKIHVDRILLIEDISQEEWLVSNPLCIDSDNDGLNDNTEHILQSNSFSSDTDGDGIMDKNDLEPTGDAKLKLRIWDMYLFPTEQDNIYSQSSKLKYKYKMNIQIIKGTTNLEWDIDHESLWNLPHYWTKEFIISDKADELIYFEISGTVEKWAHKDSKWTLKKTLTCDYTYWQDETDASIIYLPDLGMWTGDDGWSSADLNGFGFITGEGDQIETTDIDVQMHFDILIGSGFDGDGTPALTEVLKYGTSPYSTDSDGDGLEDDYEIRYNSQQMINEGITLPGLHPMSKWSDLKSIDVFDEMNFDHNNDGKADWDVDGNSIINDIDLRPRDLNFDGYIGLACGYPETLYKQDLNKNGLYPEFINGDIDGDGLNWCEEHDAHSIFKGIPLKHKDIFVEIDTMEYHSFDRYTEILVITAFAKHLYWLHLDTGWMGGGQQGLPFTWSGISLDLRDGADNDIADYKWGQGWDIGSRINKVDYGILSDTQPPYFKPRHDDNLHGYFDINRFHIYRYCLIATDAIEDDGTHHMGKGDANNIIIGDWSSTRFIQWIAFFIPAVGPHVGDEDHQHAALFMHELGHTLGLSWLGGTILPTLNEGYDPYSHPSCMNYAYILDLPDYTQDEWNDLDTSVDWRVTYEY